MKSLLKDYLNLDWENMSDSEVALLKAEMIKKASESKLETLTKGRIIRSLTATVRTGLEMQCYLYNVVLKFEGLGVLK